ncbi:EF-hand domain-containing family member B isoform X2 [Hydra vulgaris]|uniref:EF-hand domain-containing family member B isoform X2 n=1 Tax=Hydra vulgaris TaxID=6087 RepID=A0ABM4C0V6_HYDVU
MAHSAKDLINPKPLSLFREKINENIEKKIYASRKRAPLGRSYNQQERLPSSVNYRETSFGLPSIHEGDAGILINPPKSSREVCKENQIGSELYKKSHNVYDVGETCNRGYNWSYFPKSNAFGIETPHDNRGLNTKKSLKWFDRTLCEKSVKIISKQLDDFCERNSPKIGICHDPLRNTLNVDRNHAFGIRIPLDETCARDLIYMRNTVCSSVEKNYLLLVINKIRNQLQNKNYENFEELEKEFICEDKNHTGLIDLLKIEEVFLKTGIPINKKLLTNFIRYLKWSRNQKMNYSQLIQILNWKEELSDDIEKIFEIKSNANEVLQKDEPKQIQKGKIDSCSRSYGIPSIRNDLPPPTLRKIGDIRNYGDQHNFYTLMNPSKFSEYGVEPFDLSKKRSSEEIKKIFTAIGVEITDDVFCELWKKAQSKSSDGQVSIELFKSVLHQKSVEEIMSNVERIKVSNDFQATIHAALANKPKFYQKLSQIT